MGFAPAGSERISVDQPAGASHKGTDMTSKEELLYLTELVLEASKWKISEGDDSDTIRLEVQDRIRRLSGQNTIDEDGRAQSNPDFKSSDPSYEYKKQWVKDKVRIKLDDGRVRWVLKEHCHKVPRPAQPFLTKWAIKDEFKDLYK